MIEIGISLSINTLRNSEDAEQYSKVLVLGSEELHLGTEPLTLGEN